MGTQPVEFAMNIELEEVVVQDVSDDALEQAAGGAQGGFDCNYASQRTLLLAGCVLANAC